LGFLLMGVVLMLLWWRAHPEFFRVSSRVGGDVAAPAR
jgi:hypothetical protein